MSRFIHVDLTNEEVDNLLDALTEWFEAVQPKELKPDEVGLNAKRYADLIKKIKQAQKKYRDRNFLRLESALVSLQDASSEIGVFEDDNWTYTKSREENFVLNDKDFAKLVDVIQTVEGYIVYRDEEDDEEE
tara:strand:+ start:3092 stop:3487 length:396 start_codon:yes stop_codon:yes gene_type:complete